MAISNGFSLGKLIKQTTAEEGGFAGISIEGASGGGASVTTADTPPANPSAGDLWFNSSTLKTYVYYNDGTTSQWVVTNAVGTPGPQGPAGADGTNGTDLLASTYSTPDDLPTSNNTVGDQAYVTSTNRLYIWTGSGWYNIALVNTTPTWDSGGLPEAAYDLDSIGGSATSIVLSATDPEGLPLTWTYSITDSGNDLATITNDSNGTFTITAKSLADILNAGYDSDGGVFDITFKASDGVNLATALSEFTLSFALPYSFQGSNYGYTSGGSTPGASNIIDKFPFATDTNATDVGDITVARFYVAGQSSSESGYTSGGDPVTNTIDKFPFATDANATDVGDLTAVRWGLAGQSSSEYGYASAGTSGGTGGNLIDKFPFATDANATDVGDLTVARYWLAGQSSSEYGYNTGGDGYEDIIEKFPFATDANATDVGNLTTGRNTPAGQSSSSYGYSSGGYGAGRQNVIDKFPFASDANATDVGDLSVTRNIGAGQSSTDYGYQSGGANPNANNIIDKFPFATDANATDVGDLTAPKLGAAGQQY